MGHWRRLDSARTPTVEPVVLQDTGHAQYLWLLCLGALECALGETAQHMQCHFPTSFRPCVTFAEQINDGCIRAGVSGAERQASSESKSEPEELSRLRFLVCGKVLEQNPRVVHEHKRSITPSNHQTTCHKCHSREAYNIVSAQKRCAIVWRARTSTRLSRSCYMSMALLYGAIAHLNHGQRFLRHFDRFLSAVEEGKKLYVRTPESKVRSTRLTCLEKIYHVATSQSTALLLVACSDQAGNVMQGEHICVRHKRSIVVPIQHRIVPNTSTGGLHLSCVLHTVSIDRVACVKGVQLYTPTSRRDLATLRASRPRSMSSSSGESLPATHQITRENVS